MKHEHMKEIDLCLMEQVVSDNVISSLLQACKSGLFDQAQKAVSDIIDEGYPVSQILSQVSI